MLYFCLWSGLDEIVCRIYQEQHKQCTVYLSVVGFAQGLSEIAFSGIMGG
jgi:hypothetical protein